MIEKNNPYKNRLYLFDFDGTISWLDSFLLFTFYSVNIIIALKFWFFISYKLFFVSNDKGKLKELFFNNFKGLNQNEFDLICSSFSDKIIERIIKKSFKKYIQKIHPSNKIVIVSASISNYLSPWCKKNGFELISTELMKKNNILTGTFSTKNCNGIEKLNRIEKSIDLDKFSEIHVFGNSKGDIEMLSLGTHKYYKFFK